MHPLSLEPPYPLPHTVLRTCAQRRGLPLPLGQRLRTHEARSGICRFGACAQMRARSVCSPPVGRDTQRGTSTKQRSGGVEGQEPVEARDQRRAGGEPRAIESRKDY
jgi:hypothetical protein